MSDQVKDLLYNDFHKMLRDTQVKEEVCRRIYDNYHRAFKPAQVLKMSQVIEAVTEADKDLFIKFRDGQMTLDQLWVRIAERKFRMEFKCLDDLKEQKSI